MNQHGKGQSHANASTFVMLQMQYSEGEITGRNLLQYNNGSAYNQQINTSLPVHRQGHLEQHPMRTSGSDHTKLASHYDQQQRNHY